MVYYICIYWQADQGVHVRTSMSRGGSSWAFFNILFYYQHVLYSKVQIGRSPNLQSYMRLFIERVDLLKG